MVFHKLVQQDVSSALSYYGAYSERTEERFWKDLDKAFTRIGRYPADQHFDTSGLRRVNLEKYPYHVLYDVFQDKPRIWAVRHDKRKSSFGTRRFGNVLDLDK